MLPPLRFTSIDYRHTEDHSDRTVVLCDCDRPEGFPNLVGLQVSIDGTIYRVVGADNPDQPLRKDEQMVLWVEAETAPKQPVYPVARRSPPEPS